jgi:hypothetical protein
MIPIGDKMLVARLPRLGPLIGWLRGDKAQARVWAKADDVYMSAPPLAAVTVVWNASGLQPGSVQFWLVCSARMPGTQPPVVQHFALADVALGDTPPGGRVRMAFIHAIPRSAPTEGTVKAWKPRDFVCSLDTDKAMPISEIPPAKALTFDELFETKSWLAESLVRKLFEELESALARQRSKAEAIIPDTLSRQSRRVERIADCEVRWEPRDHDASTVLRFAAGCCRYPGVGFDQDLAERALGGMAQCAKSSERPDLVVMLGDQIYADATAGVLDLEEGLEKYSTRYNAAFGAKPFRELTSRLPTYMLADDHELRDGWPNDLRPGQPAAQWDDPAAWAWGLYLLHQRWHAPERPAWWRSPAGPPPERASLWYAFEHQGVPFFAFDARFERKRQPRRIVGRDQMQAFRLWLAAVKARESADRSLLHIPKFVMSGSVIAPGLRHYEEEEACARRSDNWQAYARERWQVGRLIAESGLQNVVLLSGDYHCAAAAAIRFHSPSGASRGYAIVAPPLYAPFPFANAREDDVSRKGCISWQRKRSASYRAQARALQGFALISVTRSGYSGTPNDWRVHVDFLQDCWNGRAPALSPCARAELADGFVRLR